MVENLEEMLRWVFRDDSTINLNKIHDGLKSSNILKIQQYLEEYKVYSEKTESNFMGVGVVSISALAVWGVALATSYFLGCFDKSNQPTFYKDLLVAASGFGTYGGCMGIIFSIEHYYKQKAEKTKAKIKGLIIEDYLK